MKTNIIVLVISLQDICKTSLRRLQDIFKTSLRHLQDVLKTSSRLLQYVLQRSLQDIFKTYHQVKLFLLTHFQNDFETYPKRFWDVLQRRLSIEDLPRSHFWEIYGQCANFARVTKVSQNLVFYLTTPFSGHLQKHYLEPSRTSQWRFFWENTEQFFKAVNYFHQKSSIAVVRLDWK